MNFLAGAIEQPGERQTRLRLDCGATVSADIDSSGARPGDRIELGVRPEHTVLPDHPRADNRIEGRVLVAEHLGAETFVYLEVGGADFTVRVPPETPAAPGSGFAIGVPADACYLFDAAGRAFPRTGRFVGA